MPADVLTKFVSLQKLERSLRRATNSGMAVPVRSARAEPRRGRGRWHYAKETARTVGWEGSGRQ